jgi:hypothetical protein
MSLPWRKPATSLVDTLVWDTVVCRYCDQQYIVPADHTDPCPYCAAVGRA